MSQPIEGASPRFDELEPLDLVRIVDAIRSGTDEIEVPDEWLADRGAKAGCTGSRPTSDDDESFYQQVRAMNVAQRMKLAMKGNKTARTLLLRDANKAIQRLVLQNPRITDEEVLGIAKNRNSDEELVKGVAGNRDWTKLYAVRHALVENPKTPLPRALRFLTTLAERDLARIGKSKNVQTVIAAQARRIVFQKQGSR